MSVPIAPIGGLSAAAPALGAASPAPSFVRPGAFASLLTGGVEKVEADLRKADAMARAFAVDDSVPLHQVTYALEHARLSVELMMQVRARLVEGYQDLMRMQL